MMKDTTSLSFKKNTFLRGYSVAELVNAQFCAPWGLWFKSGHDIFCRQKIVNERKKLSNGTFIHLDLIRGSLDC
jgi:hypothetical protein